MISLKIMQLAAHGRARSFAALLLGAGLCARAFAGQPYLDVRADLSIDGNLSRAEVEEFQEQDAILTVDAIGGYSQQLNDISGVVLKLGLQSELYADTRDLDSLAAVGSAALVVQPWRGYFKPWFAVQMGLRWREHRDSEIRDGTVATLALSAGKQLTDRISGQLRYEWLDRDASSGRTFELTQQTFTTVLDYRLGSRVTPYLKYEYRDGGLVTNSPPNPKFRNVTRAFAMDPVFGPGRAAWRIDGDVHSLRLGSKFTLAKRTALDFNVSYASAHADNDNQWRVWRGGVAVNHRFQ